MKEISNGLYGVTLEEMKARGKYTQRETFRFHCPVCGDEEKHRRRCDGSFNQALGVGQCFCCGSRYVVDKGHQHQGASPSAAVGATSSQPAQTSAAIGSKVCLGDYPSDIMAYLKKRGLRPDVMHLLGVGYARLYFDGEPGQDIPAGEKTCLAFRFLENGTVLNVQYKSTDKCFRFEKDGKILPYNIDAALDAETVYLTEGMMDAAVLVQCGYQGVVSLSNGTGTNMKTFDKYLDSHLKGKKIVYAGDTDEPGIKKREEVAGYFADNEVCYVEWTVATAAEVKDANDVLMAEGEEAVRRCVESAKPMPVMGVSTIDDEMDAFDELVANGIPRFPGVEHLFGFTHMIRFEPGRLMVISGVPGTGKSTFADNLVMMLAVEQGWRAAIYSPEKYPTHLHYYELGQILMGREMSAKFMSADSIARGKRFLRDNIFHISDDCMQIEQVLSVAAQMVRQKDIRVLLLDPFNYIDLPVQTGSTDTQKISMILKQIVSFARNYKVLVILVAHPRKPQADNKGQQKETVPSLYDIAGSADFYNKCDYGLILQREPESENTKWQPLTDVFVQKVRFRHLGQLGRSVFGFDPQSNRFVGTNNDNVTLRPYDRTDWTAPEVSQQDIDWQEE